MHRITILGATGSIGESTLDVIRRHPGRYVAHALSAHRQVRKLADQCIEFRPARAVVGTAEAARELETLLRDAGVPTEVGYGEAALESIAADAQADAVMAAIVGAAGLRPTLAAARAGKRVLLANKEALVMSGRIFMDAVREHGATLLPIDSEHNAIFQCLPADDPRYGRGVAKVLLTASGGPFRTRDPATLHDISPDQACAHPNWVMGRKISVDSATMMNKGLEVIEAHWLFGAPAERIEVLIHPQSIVHSMVAYADGSVLAQLGNPDMRTPIAYGLAYPERIDAGVSPLDLTLAGGLHFEKPDLVRFPCLGLAFDALRAAGVAPAVLNAANEVAVEAFLAGQVRFTDIAGIVRQVLEEAPNGPADTLEAVLRADALAREAARSGVTARSAAR
ncbi:1-deoxy-D-xylulose 5-phosphate reductoisomerase [Cupriavidus taiwanensis]|uniref:1-deoxy-D-xylulose 5-phosphate reductoisomerase n=1 Tax=Cupriavidus taiwanensis TaxID=164546 RepID=A0A976AUW7_9BURK|nr:1-deoxy-D-xylulose-5-phosphate reductoisomerase [Cupriavidus taiwanensis]SOZ52319.1 1-deoxy-D-xylulose 5-phosphate reductoisomerase [Cupriavidus taiwanensis]SOZ53817.1 1-deoxy-D-xylulose 5-phosphate reductoisomerase [Cupriavidus taiwanensis]SOZ56299.1 1-deoxy-D-xylulose 5-phosphate reductoisomerase [Cupriavidus taiwanensis]SPA04633.1 1-deoxy-D-xylulose 5-phosphate reductoisomerase [Cupriavidus taiwanensis]SPA16054.1 1-deoxy-D-xylulose 5-phosphate reductoisomerase [Cupriavidus taiwanensis]